MRATLNINELKAVLTDAYKYCGKDETRYYLMGVLIQVKDGRLRFAATNGHRLIVSERDAKDCADGQALLSAPDVKKVIALLAGKHVIPQIMIRLGEDGKIEIEHFYFSAKFKPIDGTFPDFDTAMQRKDGDDVSVKVMFGQGYLREAVATLSKSTKEPVIMEYRGEGNPVVFTRNGSKDTILVMPMAGKV